MGQYFLEYYTDFKGGSPELSSAQERSNWWNILDSGLAPRRTLAAKKVEK